MKNFRYHRVFASISAGTALMLVLSSCTTFSAKKEDSPEHPAASSSHNSYNSHGMPEKPDNCPEPGKFNPAEATSSASVSPSATPSASGGEVCRPDTPPVVWGASGLCASLKLGVYWGNGGSWLRVLCTS